MNSHQQRSIIILLLILAVGIGGYLIINSSQSGPASTRPTVGDKIENGINDALNRRPGEKALDAIEDVANDAKEVSNAVQEAIKDAVKK